MVHGFFSRIWSRIWTYSNLYSKENLEYMLNNNFVKMMVIKCCKDIYITCGGHWSKTFSVIINLGFGNGSYSLSMFRLLHYNDDMHVVISDFYSYYQLGIGLCINVFVY